MSKQSPSQSSIHAGSRANATPNKPEQTRTTRNGKGATQVPLTRSGGIGKNSANYWLGRIYKPVNGLGAESPHYMMRLKFKGDRVAFGLGTGNKTAAAAKAAMIYNDLLTLGVEETKAKHRPKTPAKPDRIATIGEWLAEAEKVSEANKTTFTAYARALRKIAGDIVNGLLDAAAKERLGRIGHEIVGEKTTEEQKASLRAEAGDIINSGKGNAGRTTAKKRSKAKADFRSSERFGPRSGGAQGFRAIVDEASLGIFTPRAIQDWRIAYVGDDSNPAAQSSRKTSCNSTIRQAMSLFSARFVYLLCHEDNGIGLHLPDPQPFYVHPTLRNSKRGSKHPLFYEEAATEYRSRIDPRELLQKAEAQLGEKDAPAFLAMLLAIAAGLRRNEIDSLRWGQIDFRKSEVRVERTATANIKTQKSQADIPVDPQTIALLRGFFAKVKDPDAYVIEGDGATDKKKWGQHYRADAAFARLIAWLRASGVKARKPIHELRKELGALITSRHGIYAAKRVLRHASVTTTARYYADTKELPVVDVGSWLNNVIELPKQNDEQAGDDDKRATR
jgi:integrase